jgi:hypothetical protein
LDYLLLLNFNCADGGRPAILAGIGHVAEVRWIAADYEKLADWAEENSVPWWDKKRVVS